MVLEKKQNFDNDYGGRLGYQPGFLNSYQIALPSVIQERELDLFMDYHSNKPYLLKYHHFSLVMNKNRRLLMWSASNVDFNSNVKSEKDRSEFGSEDWRYDPRIPEKFQISDEEFYKPATKIDRGHIVRREDNCWGESELEIEYANADTYHWTNCTPQHEEFNRDKFGKKGVWGRLENHIQSQLNSIDKRAIIFAGPILNNNDPYEDFGYGSIQYPLKFWKIITVVDGDEGLKSFGFILDQEDAINKFGLEALDFRKFLTEQRNISKISELTGVIFDEQIYQTDIFLGLLEESIKITNESDIKFSKHLQK